MKRVYFFVCAIILVLSCSGPGQRFYPASRQQVEIGEEIAVAQTEYGKVRGYMLHDVFCFHGIPYGAPTSGENRFMPPQPPQPWDGVRAAVAFGESAPQEYYDRRPESYYMFVDHWNYDMVGEDCLRLNVWTPALNDGGKRPVLVWLHGGGFAKGNGIEQDGYNGENMARRGDVVFCSINHRLNAFGFSDFSSVGGEKYRHSGNVGMLDIVAALEWVRDNIASFGGDPENMTIMGQSAGAMSVQQHALSPLSEGLFQKAIMCSGGGVNRILTATPAEKRYEYWQTAMKYAGCETLDEFRAIAPAKLFEAWDQTKKEFHNPGCFPCIDGRLVVGGGTELLKAGKQHKIPYMAGSTSEDMMPPILLSMSRKWCAAQDVPSYTWYFDRQLPGDDHGAWHSADLWYWFGTLENCWRPMEQKDRELCDQMVSYLCNFVRSGNPNKTGELPTWIASDKTQKRVLRLGEKATRMNKPSTLKMVATMLTNKAPGE